MKRWLMVWTLMLTLCLVLPHLALAAEGGSLLNGPDQQVGSGVSGGTPSGEMGTGETPQSRAWYERAWEAVKDTGSEVGKGLGAAWDTTVDAGKTAWDKTVDAGKTAWDKTVDVANSAWDRTVNGLTAAWHGTVDGLTTAWHGTVDGVTMAWNSTTYFLTHPPGWFKGLVGGVIAAAVVIGIAVVIMTLPVTAPLVLAAAALALVSATVYGIIAGEKASVGAAALIGIGTGLTVLASPSWLAGWRALTWRQLVKQSITTGLVNTAVGWALDIVEGFVTGNMPTPQTLLASMGLNFVKGALAGVLFAPVEAAATFFTFRGIVHGSWAWRWRTGLLWFVSKAGFAVSTKGIFDAIQNKAVTVRQLLAAGVLGALFGRFKVNVFKEPNANALTEEATSEGVGRWIDQLITQPAPKPAEPTQCVPHAIESSR